MGSSRLPDLAYNSNSESLLAVPRFYLDSSLQPKPKYFHLLTMARIMIGYFQIRAKQLDLLGVMGPFQHLGDIRRVRFGRGVAGVDPWDTGKPGSGDPASAPAPDFNQRKLTSRPGKVANGRTCEVEEPQHRPILTGHTGTVQAKCAEVKGNKAS